jgi:hypothetical protein
MLFLVLAGWAGAGVALVLIWPVRALIACIAAPFGGAIAASLAALWLGRRSKKLGSDKQTTDPGRGPQGQRGPMSKRGWFADLLITSPRLMFSATAPQL